MAFDPRQFFNNLPIVGGFMGSLWGDPSQEAVQAAFRNAIDEQKKMREYQMQGRMNAMNQQALAFGPRNQLLGEMMGKQGPLMDLAPMMKNPMPQQQQEDISNAAFGVRNRPSPNDALTDYFGSRWQKG